MTALYLITRDTWGALVRLSAADASTLARQGWTVEVVPCD